MTDKQQLRIEWNKATGDLPYGVQKVFKDVLTLVAEDKKKDLVYGMDYGDGGACLVNSASNMLTAHANENEGGGHGIPTAHFGEVVRLFDRINSLLKQEGVNTTSKVSPLAADILLRWFGPEKQPPAVEDIEEAKAKAFADNIPYTEPSDEEMQADFLAALTNPDREATPFDQIEFPEPVDDRESWDNQSTENAYSDTEKHEV